MDNLHMGKPTQLTLEEVLTLVKSQAEREVDNWPLNIQFLPCGNVRIQGNFQRVELEDLVSSLQKNRPTEQTAKVIMSEIEVKY